MRILDYLQSKDPKMFICGLILLGVNEDLVKEYDDIFGDNVVCCHPYLYFLKNKDGYYIGYNSFSLQIIKLISEYKVIKKEHLAMKIQFIKLKEINYDTSNSNI